jgi:rhamnogalacturonan endolyase
MNKFLSIVLTAAITVSAFTVPTYAEDTAKSTETVSYTYSYGDAETYTREMEKLDRGLIAIKSGSGVYLSWRLFDSEDSIFGSAAKNVSFNVYRGNEKIATVTDSTNYTDTTVGASYSVAPVINGVEGEKCSAVSVMDNSYFDIPLTKPADETIVQPDGTVQDTYSFSPADCSTGDVDGDGEYEIIVKWTSSERDVGEPGTPAYSGTVRFAAYKLDGTKLWDKDINLGKNVYSSAHTAQFLVYDFDGDGKAEMMVQTSLGSTDGNGEYVSHAAAEGTTIAAFTDDENASADYRGDGRVITGEEFLTVFNGETGAAIDTIDLPTSRGSAKGVDYGDDFGNRSNRFLANVAYLDGEKPYAVYMRGYYFGRNGNQRTSIAGISFNGERLSPDYRFDTKEGQPGYYEGAYQYVGQGNHNCTVADVDNDGKDEFITGALCMEVNDDGEFKPKWCTYLQHGDALHIGDYDPTHPGFEFFTVHEDTGTNTLSGTDITMDYGMSLIDAATGEIMFHQSSSSDNGRGIMANVGSGGYYQMNSSKAGHYQANGNNSFTTLNYTTSVNFRVFWDGDLYDELLDGTTITSWNSKQMASIFTASGCTEINGTKANPALQADLLGDWREEVVYPTTDGNSLRVFTTTTSTEYKIKTLMQDPVYRSGVAAEQTAYNQPPHVGFYLSSELFTSPTESIEITSLPTKTVYSIGDSFDRTGLKVTATLENGEKNEVTAFTVSGYDPETTGEQTLTVKYMGKTATFTVTVKDISGITIAQMPTKTTYSQGQTLDTSGMVVKAVYTDGTSSEISSGYEVSGYNSENLGSQTVTVTYKDKTATFTVEVTEASISAMNNTYVTTSTSSSVSEIPIGSYSGTFTLEHTVKINSMPANGAEDKNDTSGFLIKFMPQHSTSSTVKDGVGAGWYMSASGTNQANILWKSDGRNATKVTSTALNIGEEYTFRYTFSNIGVGSAAAVELTILNSNGETVGSVSGLSLRNMTSSNVHLTTPLAYILLYNQAKSNSTASVTIDNAKIYGSGSVISVDGSNVTLNTSTLSRTKVYAAKYNNGVLENIADITPTSIGQQTVTADFEPDKVFIWTSDMYPITVWEKSE